MSSSPIKKCPISKIFQIFTFYDKIIIIALLLLALGSLFLFKHYKNNADIILIEVNGKEILRVSLNQDSHFLVDGFIGKTAIEIKNKRVRVIDSPCKNKLCVHSGWIDKPYQTIICAPNRVAIRFANSSKPVDAVTR